MAATPSRSIIRHRMRRWWDEAWKGPLVLHISPLLLPGYLTKRAGCTCYARYYERRYSQLGHKMVASWSLNLLPKWQQPWSWGLGCKSEQKSSKGWPRQWGHFWPHKVTFVPTDWCVLVLFHVHLNFWRVNFQELTPRMQKCPKMSIVVTPAVGSLLTEPPGNHFMPQLAVPSFNST